MILYKNMNPIEHVLLHPIWVLSHLMCECKHCNINLSSYYWTYWSCWLIYHLKKTDLTRFFIIKPRHPCRLNKTCRRKKPSVGAVVIMGVPRNFSREGKVAILLIFFRLLGMQRKWTYTKKKMSNVTATVAYSVFLYENFTHWANVLVSMDIWRVS